MRAPAVVAAMRMPRNWAPLPTAIARVRSVAGNQRAATLVVALSTSGWPTESTICPARTHP